MEEPLALKYRPKSFSDLVGQNRIAVTLEKMVEKDRLPQGLLFSGVRGSGKTSAARILSGSDSGTAIEVDAASHGSVDDVRQMIDALKYGNVKFVVYDEAHSMSKEAFNALLKTLEEPPTETVFILVTTEPDKIPATVKSRLMEFAFTKISPAVIIRRLVEIIKAEGIKFSADLARLIAIRADGSMRDAIMLLDQCWRAEITSVSEFLELGGEVDVGPEMVQALMTGDAKHIFETSEKLSDLVSDPSKLSNLVVNVIKDVLVLKSGGTVEASETGQEQRKEIALALESERLLGALRVLWDLKTKIRAANDPKSNLDLALILISEVFTRGKQAQVRPVQKVVSGMDDSKSFEEEKVAEPRRLTLAEL